MPVLSSYENSVKDLLQPAWSGIISDANLDFYINRARLQTAIDAECVRDRVFVTAPASVNIIFYNQIANFPNGVLQPIAVREAMVNGAQWPMQMRSWEWYWNYYNWNLGATGEPFLASQLGQGDDGKLFIYPTPDRQYILQLDATFLPIILVDDTTLDRIPYPWTDAVPFYAAWLAFQQLQRQADAQMMLDRYKELALRGRQGSTPSVLPDNYQGGVGAKLAASRSTLTMAPRQPALGG